MSGILVIAAFHNPLIASGSVCIINLPVTSILAKTLLLLLCFVANILFSKRLVADPRQCTRAEQKVHGIC